MSRPRWARRVRSNPWPTSWAVLGFGAHSPGPPKRPEASGSSTSRSRPAWSRCRTLRSGCPGTPGRRPARSRTPTSAGRAAFEVGRDDQKGLVGQGRPPGDGFHSQGSAAPVDLASRVSPAYCASGGVAGPGAARARGVDQGGLVRPERHHLAGDRPGARAEEQPVHGQLRGRRRLVGVDRGKPTTQSPTAGGTAARSPPVCRSTGFRTARERPSPPRGRRRPGQHRPGAGP